MLNFKTFIGIDREDYIDFPYRIHIITFSKYILPRAYHT